MQWFTEIYTLGVIHCIFSLLPLPDWSLGIHRQHSSSSWMWIQPKQLYLHAMFNNKSNIPDDLIRWVHYCLIGIEFDKSSTVEVIIDLIYNWGGNFILAQCFYHGTSYTNKRIPSRTLYLFPIPREMSTHVKLLMLDDRQEHEQPLDWWTHKGMLVSAYLHIYHHSHKDACLLRTDLTIKKQGHNRIPDHSIHQYQIYFCCYFTQKKNNRILPKHKTGSLGRPGDSYLQHCIVSATSLRKTEYWI